MVCWGLEFLIHFSALGVHQFNIIIITIVIPCIYVFVDLGMVTILGWE